MALNQLLNVLQVAVVFAALSVSALSFVALRALWLVASPLFVRNARQTVSKEHVFFHTQLGDYYRC